MKLKHLLLTLATTLATLTPTTVQANSLHEAHSSLWDSLKRVGVSVYVNDPDVCRGGDIDGRYHSTERRLDVCQDNYQPYQQSLWSANDLDTLRHEAHHVLQDCVGKPYDAELDTFIEDSQYETFIQTTLTQEQIKNIIEQYSAQGANEHTLMLELEAFSVARSVSADLIGQKLVEFCDTSLIYP